MTIQTATLDTRETVGFKASHRLVQLGLTAAALAGLAAVAPSGITTFVGGAVLSAGLAGWSVVRVIRADRLGLSNRPSIVEMAAGALLVASMIWLAHVLTVGLFAGGLASTIALLSALAVIAVIETVDSALACYVIKRFAATGAIGAEVAVMLNMQQKYAISLDGTDR
ncbi:hypothetical protein ACFQ14_11380 [Pseudahrensia aquimaris]|uniref:Uncharacterized protein n=1 Tax=Pseudahrensia aquimaris TaxID=744461 RepID=A0ABW3FEW8_9HYPH